MLLMPEELMTVRSAGSSVSTPLANSRMSTVSSKVVSSANEKHSHEIKRSADASRLRGFAKSGT